MAKYEHNFDVFEWGYDSMECIAGCRDSNCVGYAESAQST